MLEDASTVRVERIRLKTKVEVDDTADDTTNRAEPKPQSDLEQIAEGLQSVHDRLDRNGEQLVANRAEWRELTLEQCQLYYEGRTLHPSNEAFSGWLTKHDLDQRLNDHDRAAAIEMGSDPEHTRTILAQTERRSIRLIHEKEWRVGRAANTGRAKPRNNDPDPATAKARTPRAPKRATIAKQTQKEIDRFSRDHKIRRTALTKQLTLVGQMGLTSEIKSSLKALADALEKAATEIRERIAV